MKKKYPTFYTSLFISLLLVSRVFSQTRTIPFQELPDFQAVIPGSGIFFGASMTSSSITVTFSGPSDRWIALGIGSFMSPTDVLMYSNGKSTAPHPLGWNDYYNASTSATDVNNDAVQNWNIISTGTISPGTRTVVATRPLSTGDLSDVIVNFNAAALSLVWAKGASADYTVAYHGGQNRAYGFSLPWLSPPTASFTTASTTLCAGSSLFYSNLSTGGLTSYTWSFPGGSPASSTSTNPSVFYNTPGTYSVVLTASNAVGSNVLSQVNYITVTPTVAPAISIAQSGGSNPICSGAAATFTSLLTNGGSAPTFQWKVNGVNTGITTFSYSSSSLPSPAIITCVMTSNALCVSPASATSAAITLTVNSSAAATASIVLTSGSNPLCNGSPLSFSVITGNGGTSPTYQWNVSGIPSGNNSTFTSSSLSNGAVVNCIVSSNAPCASSTLAVSAGITMTVSSVLVPSVSIALAGTTTAFCAGAPVTLTASPVNGGANPTYQWVINGLSAGITGSVFTSSGLTNGAGISCVMISGLSCSSPNSATSAAVSISVNAIPPAPTITASGPTNFCAGASLVLSSSAPTGNIWSDGSNSPSITVNATGIFTVTQSVNGCLSPPSFAVNITVNQLPVVSLQTVSPVCFTSPDLQLTQGQPAGGSFSGTGVVNNLFSPQLSGIGSFNIMYSFTNTANCSNTAAITIVVDQCLGISNNKNADPDVSVFPNPCSGQLIISSAKEKIRGLRITDLSGKIILNSIIKNEEQFYLDISKEAAGLYQVDILLEGRTVHKQISKKASE